MRRFQPHHALSLLLLLTLGTGSARTLHIAAEHPDTTAAVTCGHIAESTAPHCPPDEPSDSTPPHPEDCATCQMLASSVTALIQPVTVATLVGTELAPQPLVSIVACADRAVRPIRGPPVPFI